MQPALLRTARALGVAVLGSLAAFLLAFFVWPGSWVTEAFLWPGMTLLPVVGAALPNRVTEGGRPTAILVSVTASLLSWGLLSLVLWTVGRSVNLRRLVGWTGLVSLPLLVLSALTGREMLALIALFFGLCVPTLTMILHLNATRALSPADKAVWRRELWVGHRALVAVWTYLLSSDLAAATRGLAVERR